MRTSLFDVADVGRSRPAPRKILHAVVWSARHLTGRYRVPELAYLQRFISRADVCVDVGAHAGAWLLPLARLVPDGQAVGFEALPYYADVLELTRRMFGVRNATVVTQAVTEGPCRVPLIWKSPSGRRLTGLTHIAGPGDEKAHEAISVEGGSLDNYFAGNTQRISFIKCDVEGAEMGVLQGAKDTFARWRPVVYIEIVGDYLRRHGHTKADVHHFFRSRDYLPFVFGADGVVARIEDFAASETNDVLFIPRELTAPDANDAALGSR